MKTLTIRGLPDKVHGALKERAQLNRRSLNQEVIAELAAGAMNRPVKVDEETRKRQRAELIIAKVNRMRSGMTRFMTEKEIDEAIREGKR